MHIGEIKEAHKHFFKHSLLLIIMANHSDLNKLHHFIFCNIGHYNCTSFHLFK